MSSAYYTIPFQYLKTVVPMQDSALSETGNQCIFLKRVTLMLEQARESKQRRIHLFCTVWNLLFQFLS